MVWVQFVVCSALIVFAAMQLAKYGDVIAERTGMGGMFIGVLLLAGATSLPELLTTISSVIQGVPNLAAGNLLGSNMFNMFVLAILDLVHRKERLLRKAALKHALSGSLAVFMIGLVVFFIIADIPTTVFLLMTGMGLIGNLARLERRVLFVELDALVLMITYFLGMWLLYNRGIGS